MANAKSKFFKNKNIIILAGVIGIILSAIPQTIENNEFLFYNTELELTPLTITGFQVHLGDVLKSDWFEKKCYLKMTVDLQDTKGQIRSLQSPQFDTPFSQLFDTLDILDLQQQVTYVTYEPIVKMRCEDVRDKEFNKLLPFYVTPNANMLLKVVAFDIDGSKKNISTHSLTFSQLNERVELNGDPNMPNHEEILFSFGKRQFSVVDDMLSESPTVYRSTIHFTLSGSINIFTPFLNSNDNTSGEFKVTHSIATNQVVSSFLTQIDKIPPSVDGGGDEIDIISYNPKIVDYAKSNAQNKIVVKVKLNNWSESEGNPFIQIKKFNGVALTNKIQMTYERTNGVDDFFTAEYRAISSTFGGLPVGTYKIEATSALGANGFAVRSTFGFTTVATVTFTVIDSSPPTKTCPDGSVILTTSTCPVGGTTKTCPDGSVIPIAETCGGTKQTCRDGSLIGVNETCPSNGETKLCEDNDSTLCQIYRLLFNSDGSFNTDTISQLGNLIIGILVLIIIIFVLIKIIGYLSSRKRSRAYYDD